MGNFVGGVQMGMFAEATGAILRLPRFLGTGAAHSATFEISASQLEALLKEAAGVIQEARDLVSGRSLSKLTTSLESTSWSVAQNLDHLTKTTNAFLPPISAAIARAPRLTRNRALRTGALAQLLIRSLEPPYRLRFKVLAALVPHQQDFSSAWAGFADSHAELGKTIESAAGLAIDQVRIESPVYARFSYNVYGALCMLTAHQRRHLWQMEQILKALDGAPARKAS